MRILKSMLSGFLIILVGFLAFQGVLLAAWFVFEVLFANAHCYELANVLCGVFHYLCFVLSCCLIKRLKWTSTTGLSSAILYLLYATLMIYIHEGEYRFVFYGRSASLPHNQSLSLGLTLWMAPSILLLYCGDTRKANRPEPPRPNHE